MELQLDAEETHMPMERWGTPVGQRSPRYAGDDSGLATV